MKIVSKAAATLAVVLLAAMPAQAAGVQFQFGASEGFGFKRHLICIELTDAQIRAAVKEQGYSNIYLNVRNDRRIQVRATKGEWVYLLRVSTCTGAILDRDRLRHAS
jgi:hypothetical protein